MGSKRIKAKPEKRTQKQIKPVERPKYVNPCEACLCHWCRHVNNGEGAPICRGRAYMHCGNCNGRSPKHWCDDVNRKVVEHEASPEVYEGDID